METMILLKLKWLPFYVFKQPPQGFFFLSKFGVYDLSSLFCLASAAISCFILNCVLRSSLVCDVSILERHYIPASIELADRPNPVLEGI